MTLESYDEKRRKVVSYNEGAGELGKLSIYIAVFVAVIAVIWGKTLLDEWWREAESNLGVEIPSMKEAAIARSDYEYEHNPALDALFHMLPEVPEDLDVRGAAPLTAEKAADTFWFIGGMGLLFPACMGAAIYCGVRFDLLTFKAFCSCGHHIEYHIGKDGNFAKCRHSVKPEQKRTWRTAFKIYKCSCTEYREDAQTKKRQIPAYTAQTTHTSVPCSCRLQYTNLQWQ